MVDPTSEQIPGHEESEQGLLCSRIRSMASQLFRPVLNWSWQTSSMVWRLLKSSAWCVSAGTALAQIPGVFVKLGHGRVVFACRFVQFDLGWLSRTLSEVSNKFDRGTADRLVSTPR